VQEETHKNETILTGITMFTEKELVAMVLHMLPKTQLKKLHENNIKPFSCSLKFLWDYPPHL